MSISETNIPAPDEEVPDETGCTDCNCHAEQRARPDELSVGNFVSWNSSGGRANGKINRIVRDGQINVPDSSFTITGTEDDPAALITVYRNSDDGYEATDRKVGHKFSTLRKIANLRSNSINADSVIATIRTDDESETMTESQVTTRDKWVRAAWSIKARIEGLTEEARALGKTEVRTGHTDLEIRETGDGMTFEGYAAVFNSPSQPLPFVETIKPGAFKRSLQGRHRMMLLWNHNASEPLASTRNGTLKLVEDARGLKVTATLANTQTGRDVAELLRSKTIDAMSFGFQVKKDSWSADGNNRTLEEVAVHEVSLTSFPAYEGTAGTTSVREMRDIDADQLADSLMKLESGEELDSEQAKIISEVVDKLTKTEEVQEVDGDILALKKKKLDLLLKEAV